MREYLTLKNAEREEIRKLTEEFLANGGKVITVALGKESGFF